MTASGQTEKREARTHWPLRWRLRRAIGVRLERHDRCVLCWRRPSGEGWSCHTMGLLFCDRHEDKVEWFARLDPATMGRDAR